jgi:hypothetical protein
MPKVSLGKKDKTREKATSFSRDDQVFYMEFSNLFPVYTQTANNPRETTLVYACQMVIVRIVF